MNKREIMFSLLDPQKQSDTIPAAFFMHFDPTYHRNQAAVEKHLEYFHYTNMDFIKIQYEHVFPTNPDLTKPTDWSRIPLYGQDFFEEPLRVVEGLVKRAKAEALIIVTLYSPFMVAGQINGQETITRHILEAPEKVKVGMEIVTESMLAFVRGCIHCGVDGFYTSTQGAEIFRFPNFDPFYECIKPYDLIVMNEVNQTCPFNILHVCDFHGGYGDFTPVLDYPGQIVNCSLNYPGGKRSALEIAALFNRPFMGGLERKGVIASGSKAQIQTEVQEVLKHAPTKFILAADCTVPGDTPWGSLRTAIQTAHDFKPL
jgi:uroporphyrinogen decarboxylase